MSAAPEEGKRRGLLDPLRWMDGVLAALSWGVLALAGVAAAVASLVFVVLLAAGRVRPETGMVVVLATGAASILLFVMHNRAERFAAVKTDSAKFPRARTVPFIVSPEGNWVRQVIEGHAGGLLVVHDDHLFVQITRNHPEWMAMGWVLLSFEGTDDRIRLAAYMLVIVLALVDQVRKRTESRPWGEIPGVVARGDMLIVEFASADGRKDLVLKLQRRDMERLLPLLREHTAVEVLPPPPKPERTPRPPRPPRPPQPPKPPKPPETAIDGGTVDTLDRALDGIRKLRP